MKSTKHHDERIANMTFASVYPQYVTKVENKEQTEKELHQVIEWLTGFDEKALNKQIKDKVTFKEFFDRATLNPNANLIKGLIMCCQRSLVLRSIYDASNSKLHNKSNATSAVTQ